MNIKDISYFNIFLFFFFTNIVSENIDALPMYFCTASDYKFFTSLVNLIGSLHATNFDNTEEIAVFDLGLTTDQKAYLNSIEKVNVYQVELTHPDLLKPVDVNNKGRYVPGWYAWKPVILKQALDMFPYALYIDSAHTILKPLDDLFYHIKDKGYFFSTIGDEKWPDGEFKYNVNWQTTHYIKEKFNLYYPQNQWVLQEPSVDASIIGISQIIKNEIIEQMYEMTKDLKNFIDDGSTPEGFGTSRHDQSILTILCILYMYEIYMQDHSQETPMILNSNPFYRTYRKDYLCDKTHIYHSRGIYNLDYYVQQIRYKK